MTSPQQGQVSKRRVGQGAERRAYQNVTTPLHYLKLIKSVRLSVEALSFKGSFVAFALC
jgi:hypothetical protein